MIISVEDANDNIPVFTRSHYDVTFDENTIPPIVTRVSAHDNDEGSNAVIRYSITRGQFISACMALMTLNQTRQ